MAALDAQASRAAFGSSGAAALAPDAQQVVLAWNLMGGQIDWAALPIVCDLLGEPDPERLIRCLTTVRDALTERHERAPSIH